MYMPGIQGREGMCCVFSPDLEEGAWCTDTEGKLSGPGNPSSGSRMQTEVIDPFTDADFPHPKKLISTYQTLQSVCKPLFLAINKMLFINDSFA